MQEYFSLSSQSYASVPYILLYINHSQHTKWLKSDETLTVESVDDTVYVLYPILLTNPSG